MIAVLGKSCNGNNIYTTIRVNFRHSVNNHITVSRYGTSNDKFCNHGIKSSNKNEHVSKEPYFKFLL